MSDAKKSDELTMRMTRFYDLFADAQTREYRGFRFIPGCQGALPADDFRMIEFFCEDAGCDCRQVLLLVVGSAAPPEMAFDPNAQDRVRAAKWLEYDGRFPAESPRQMAWIRFGWEAASFYESMVGGREAAMKITAGYLDPSKPQSKWAAGLLAVARLEYLRHPEFQRGVAERYAEFRQRAFRARKSI